MFAKHRREEELVVQKNGARHSRFTALLINHLETCFILICIGGWGHANAIKTKLHTNACL